MKKIKAYIFGVPFRIFGFWDYYNERISKPLKKKGFDVGKILYKTKIGELVCLLRNSEHEFIYKVIDKKRLKGSDFLYETDMEFDLEFHKRIKIRND